MQAMRVDAHVVAVLSQSELVLLANGINEALEALDGWAFQTRMGGSIDEARLLQREVLALIGNPPS